MATKYPIFFYKKAKTTSIKICGAKGIKKNVIGQKTKIAQGKTEIFQGASDFFRARQQSRTVEIVVLGNYSVNKLKDENEVI